jgi:uncharacterized RDD family membrane protein YckC
MRDLHAIRTPENVTFEFELAGLATRAMAWVIDIATMAALFAAATLVFSVFGLVVAGFAKALYFVALFAIQWGYGALLEWRWSGQTLGKRVLGVRVLSSHGTPITFAQAAVRNLLRLVDILPIGYLVGAVSVLVHRRARRFGDIAADTVVVRTRRSERPAAITAPSDRYNSLERDTRLAHAAWRISAPERDAMLALTLRREQLPLPVRHRLFAKLATHLEQRLGLSRPAYFSEERFVLNIAAVAFARDEREGSKRASSGRKSKPSV